MSGTPEHTTQMDIAETKAPGTHCTAFRIHNVGYNKSSVTNSYSYTHIQLKVQEIERPLNRMVPPSSQHRGEHIVLDILGFALNMMDKMLALSLVCRLFAASAAVIGVSQLLLLSPHAITVFNVLTIQSDTYL